MTQGISSDPFTVYETGIQRLLDALGEAHPQAADARVFQMRLLENIALARRYGDTETRRAERMEIVDGINTLAVAVGAPPLPAVHSSPRSHILWSLLAVIGGVLVVLLVIITIRGQNDNAQTPTPTNLPDQPTTPSGQPTSPVPTASALIVGSTSVPQVEPTATMPTAIPVATITQHSQRIAFVSDRDGNREIYTINADGSGMTRLTNNPGIDTDPTWSPDGQRIAFRSNRDGMYAIYIMNADGSGITRLPTTQPNAGEPAWSPDGQRIAFTAESPDPGREIYVINLDGSGEIPLTSTAAAALATPTWSPDGKRIAFIWPRDLNVDIYVLNVDESDPTRLTTHPEIDAYPAWSPDGRHIAFVSTRDSPGDIYVMNVDGSGISRLTTGVITNGGPAWSPGSRTIAFTSRFEGTPEIYTISADGSAPTRLTTDAAVAPNFTPAWSR